MFRKGGIFAGLGETPAPTLQNLMIPLIPSAGGQPITTPFASMLQQYLKTTGSKNLPVDGQWGQCSHSAFAKNIGVPPSVDSLTMLFQLDKFGVPPSNIQVWKPGPYDTCSGGKDAYEAPPVEQQIAKPEPALLLAKLFGVSPPAGVCPMPNQVPDMNSGRCVCGSGYYQNPNTGECVQVEGPGKMTGGATTGGGTTSSTGTRLVTMTAQPKFQVIGASTQQVKPGTTSLRPAPSSTAIQRVAPSQMSVLPGRISFPARPAGMSTGAKVALGALALGAVGLAAWFVLRKKDEPLPAEDMGLVPNCGWRPNCGE